MRSARARFRALAVFTAASLGLLIGGLQSAAQAGAVPGAVTFKPGSYSLSYLSGPSHTLTATQCLVFTAGSIGGFPHSGTWVATTFAGFAGNWIQDGKDLRFYGTFGGGGGVIAHHVNVTKKTPYKGGFDDFPPSAPPTYSNDGQVTLTPGCALAVRGGSGGADPTR